MSQQRANSLHTLYSEENEISVSSPLIVLFLSKLCDNLNLFKLNLPFDYNRTVPFYICHIFIPVFKKGGNKSRPQIPLEKYKLCMMNSLELNRNSAANYNSTFKYSPHPKAFNWLQKQ